MFDFDAHCNAPLFGLYGRPVTFSPANKLVKPGDPFIAIFDREHEIILDELANSELRGSGHSTTVPVLTIRLADFATRPAQGDQVTVLAHLSRPTEGTWTVWDVKPDGEGCADLLLREVA